eukprot:247268-Amorphochlora_amoeboformis.AAC.1
MYHTLGDTRTVNANPRRRIHGLQGLQSEFGFGIVGFAGRQREGVEDFGMIPRGLLVHFLMDHLLRKDKLVNA